MRVEEFPPAPRRRLRAWIFVLAASCLGATAGVAWDRRFFRSTIDNAFSTLESGEPSDRAAALAAIHRHAARAIDCIARTAAEGGELGADAAESVGHLRRRLGR